MSSGDQIEIPSATVVDLTAYYKPMKDLTVRAGVMNLTNEKYYSWNDVRGQSELKLEDTQAERNYTLSVKYDFWGLAFRTVENFSRIIFQSVMEQSHFLFGYLHLFTPLTK